MTDHNVKSTLEIVDRAYIIFEGKVLFKGRPDEIIKNKNLDIISFQKGCLVGNYCICCCMTFVKSIFCKLINKIKNLFSYFFSLILFLTLSFYKNFSLFLHFFFFFLSLWPFLEYLLDQERNQLTLLLLP